MGVELDRAGRVKVRSDLTIERHPEVFVIGDLAACVDAAGRTMPGLAPVAIQQGRCAADEYPQSARGQATSRSLSTWTRERWRRSGALTRSCKSGKFKLSGLFAWLIWSMVHIAYLVGFRNRVIVMFEWAWAYLTYQRGARLITGDDRRIARMTGHAGMPRMQNLEAKFKLDDLERARKQAEAIEYQFTATLLQRDTFFRVKEGKLKLREEESGAWMIFYGRAGQPGSQTEQLRNRSDRGA